MEYQIGQLVICSTYFNKELTEDKQELHQIVAFDKDPHSLRIWTTCIGPSKLWIGDGWFFSIDKDLQNYCLPSHIPCLNKRLLWMYKKHIIRLAIKRNCASCKVFDQRKQVLP